MLEKDLLARAAIVREINEYGWDWPFFRGHPDHEAKASMFIARTTSLFDQWFDFMRQNHSYDWNPPAISRGKVKENYGGDELETAVKAGTSLVWAEKVVTTSNHPQRDITADNEKITRRWIYMQIPLSGVWQKFAPPGAHCVKQLLVGIVDQEIKGGLIGDRIQPGLGVDAITGIFIEADDLSDENFEYTDPFSVEQVTIHERANVLEPVFEDGCQEINDLFPNSDPVFAEIRSPLQLLAGLNAALDDIERVFYEATAAS